MVRLGSRNFRLFADFSWGFVVKCVDHRDEPLRDRGLLKSVTEICFFFFFFKFVSTCLPSLCAVRVSFVPPPLPAGGRDAISRVGASYLFCLIELIFFVCFFTCNDLILLLGHVCVREE